MSRAWQDEDDTHLNIDPSLNPRTKKLSKEPLSGPEFSEKLREKYQSIYKPTWDSVSQTESNLSKLFLTSKTILSDKTPLLQPTILDIKQVPHANQSNPSSSVITCTAFQDNHLLIGGKDKRVKIFEVGLEGNMKTCVYFKDLPVMNAEFCDNKVYVSGEKPYFYIFDQVKEDVQRVPFVQGYVRQPLGPMKISPDCKSVMFLGQNGKLMQVSTQSSKLITEFKMNSTSRGLCFVDEYTVACGGDEGDVYLWDLKMRACVQRFSDEGTVKITCIEARDNLLAVGSNSGVVNLYDMNREDFRNTDPKPIKSVMNLTTETTGLQFNHNCEILIMWSKWKRDAVKLLHVPSLTVFSNFPSFRDKIKYPMSAAFNSNSELLCIGNDEGNALLYKLNHYC